MTPIMVSVPLDIPDVRRLSTEVNAQPELIITVESTKLGMACRRCGEVLHNVHGHEAWGRVRHLPVFGRPAYLRYRPQRYQCQRCEGHPTTTERWAWQVSNSPHTLAYDRHLVLQLVNATVEDVSRKAGVSYDRVLGAVERQLSAVVDWSAYAALACLGLDEIALKKGHRDFVVIVTARLADRHVVILSVLPDRQKATVVQFLHTIPTALQATIQTACCAMWEAYTEAVREVWPAAKRVIDRFHVAQHYHAAADHLRQHELKRLKREWPHADYQALTGSLWVFRKKSTTGLAEEPAVLERLFVVAPCLKQAHTLREQLTTIFHAPLAKAEAQLKIQAWSTAVQDSGLTCFDAFVKTLTRWWQAITNYFETRANRGFVEGLNNKLKVLKRRCYGVFTLAHLFQRIYLDLEGYRLFAV